MNTLVETTPMVKEFNFHANSLTYTGDDFDFSFDPKEYSLFKFGSTRLSTKFGRELAVKFFRSVDFRVNLLPQMIAGVQVVVYPSAYNFIPAASSAMLDAFISKFHELCYESEYNLLPLQLGRIFWDYKYFGEYGTADRAGRDKCIPADAFHIDAEFTKGKVLMFFDDIRITGSHESRIINCLNRNNITNDRWFLQYAALTNPDEAEASVENYLNFAAIKNLDEFNAYMEEMNFHFNARNVRNIMTAETGMFMRFIHNRSPRYQRELFNLAIGNGYRDLDACKTNIAYLFTLI